VASSECGDSGHSLGLGDGPPTGFRGGSSPSVRVGLRSPQAKL